MIDRWYWVWRLSALGRLCYLVMSFVFIQINAFKIARQLKGCLTEVGRMNHLKDDQTVMTMTVKTRSDLIHRGWNVLPKWKW